MNNLKKKVSFFFGAGAEICFNVNSGYDFMINTIYKVSEEYKNIVTEYSKHRFFITNNNTIPDYLINKYIDCLVNEKKLELDKEDINELKELLLKVELSVFVNAIYALKNKKSRSNIYNFLERLCKNDELKKEALINAFECNRLTNKLDAYFYNLIDPNKYNEKEYYMVFNYYWFCFVDIISSLRKIDKIDNNKIDNLYDFIKYSKQIQKNKDIKKRFNFENTYYGLIKDYITKNNIDVNCIVTTNYTKLSSYILDGKKTYNIHGDLNTFECSDRLEFKKMLTRKDYEEHKYFPFLMGLSNVKPIVSYEQIEKFHKAFQKIYLSDILLVIGYRLNENDSHINEMLRKFVLKNKIIIFLSDMNKKDVLSALKINEEKDNITCLKYVDNIKDSCNLLFNELKRMAK